MFSFGIVILSLLFLWAMRRGGVAKFIAAVFCLGAVVIPMFGFTYIGFPFWPWIIVIIVGVGLGLLQRKVLGSHDSP